ncbi:hypothetical protein JCM10207_006844 [Rhodosporidiobolus poonsookiae]
MIPWSTLFALLAVALAVFCFLPPLPSPPHPPRLASFARRGTPLDKAGPVLASRVEHLQLDGLTIVPITRLPRLKTRFLIPYTAYKLHLSLDITASELVFPLLHVKHALVRGRDLGNEPVELSTQGVDIEMRGSIGLRFEVALEGQAGKRWSWSGKRAGRVELAMQGAAFDMSGQLVVAPRTTEGGFEPGVAKTALSPRLALVSSSLSTGFISLLSLTPSFVPLPDSIAGYITTTVVPLFRNATPARWLTGKLAVVLLRDVLEGHVVDELLGDLAGFARQFVDTSAFEAITAEERDDVLAAAFADGAASLSQPAPHDPPATETPPAFLRLTVILRGPILLNDLTLPSSTPDRFLPIFSRATSTSSDGSPTTQRKGLRHTLLSSPLFNQLTTGPPAVSLGTSAFDRLSFSAARVVLTPPSPSSDGARELHLEVDALDAVLTTQFRLDAELRRAPALLAGGREWVETGSVSTLVSSVALPPPSSSSSTSSASKPAKPAEPLRVVLPLSFTSSTGQVRVLGRPSASFAANVARPGGVRLEGSFARVEPQLRLETRLGKVVGERVVNALLEAVQGLVAPLAVPLASFFVADLAAARLQRALDDVCTRVRDEGGIEWTLPVLAENAGGAGAAAGGG